MTPSEIFSSASKIYEIILPASKADRVRILDAVSSQFGMALNATIPIQVATFGKQVGKPVSEGDKPHNKKNKPEGKSPKPVVSPYATMPSYKDLVAKEAEAVKANKANTSDANKAAVSTARADLKAAKAAWKAGPGAQFFQKVFTL